MTIRTILPFVGALLFPLFVEAAEEKTKLENVSPAEAAALVEKEGKDLLILDIRTKEEYDGGHLKGAVNEDFFGPDFEKRLAKYDRKAPCLVHCASGGRSGKSLAILKKAGFVEVYHLDAGFQGWKSGGYPVEE